MSSAIAAAAATIIGAVSYLFLGRDVLLAGWTTLAWFVTVRTALTLSHSGKALNGRGGIIAGTLSALALGAALLGVGPFLPIPPEVRAALQLLVMGTGFACGSVSVLLVLRIVDETQKVTTGSVSEGPSDDTRASSPKPS